MTSAMTIQQLNAADRAAFVAAVGFTFENSPWIAEETWLKRPFSDLATLEDAMVYTMERAPEARQLALIRAHPDLAGRVAREGRLTASSEHEQAAAGLRELNAEELARFEKLNAAYRGRFGFPFVICAREHTKVSILNSLERRLQNERSTEISTALAEIGKIARLRLRAAVG